MTNRGFPYNTSLSDSQNEGLFGMARLGESLFGKEGHPIVLILLFFFFFIGNIFSWPS
jgi:hypothetical protein